MADFLISARITLPNGLLEQAQALAKVAEPLAEFGAALDAAVGVTVRVDVAQVRAAKGSVAALNPDRPKRGRKPRVAGGANGPQADLSIGAVARSGHPDDRSGSVEG